MALTSRVVTREIWAVRDIVKLHAVEWRPRDGEAGAPIMAIGGALSNAWDAEELGRAAETPYWDDLASLGLPVLTITGTAEGVRASPMMRSGIAAPAVLGRSSSSTAPIIRSP